MGCLNSKSLKDKDRGISAAWQPNPIQTDSLKMGSVKIQNSDGGKKTKKQSTSKTPPPPPPPPKSKINVNSSLVAKTSRPSPVSRSPSTLNHLKGDGLPRKGLKLMFFQKLREKLKANGGQ